MAQEKIIPAQNAQETVFDDVFKTILAKMPGLAIPLINEAFDRDYPPDTEIIPARGEHHMKYGKIIGDSYLQIGEKQYHLECQSTSDGRMVVRMLEYDFAFGLEHVEKEEGQYQLKLPDSCVLFLRGTPKSKKKLEMKMEFPGGKAVTYSVPIIRLSDYSLQKIVEKKLLFFLPYYMINYENSKDRLEREDSYLSAMLEEYREIMNFLEQELLEKEREKEYRYLVELIRRIVDYILRDTEKPRQEVDRIVGGKVLELETDRLIQEGVKQGIEQGEKRGEKNGMVKKAMLTAQRMHEKSYTDADIADLLEYSIDTIRSWLYDNQKELAAK